MTLDADVLEARRDAIRRLFAAVSSGQLDSALSFYTDDRPTYSFPRLGGIETVCGKPAIRSLYQRQRAAYQSALVFVPRTILVDGDLGAIEWEHSATTAGGSAYTSTGVHILEFTPEGLIQHVRSYLDTNALARVLRAERREA